VIHRPLLVHATVRARTAFADTPSYALCVRPISRRDACTARCNGTLNNAATFDNERVSVSALVYYVQLDICTVEETRERYAPRWLTAASESR